MGLQKQCNDASGLVILMLGVSIILTVKEKEHG